MRWTTGLVLGAVGCAPAAPPPAASPPPTIEVPLPSPADPVTDPDPETEPEPKPKMAETETDLELPKASDPVLDPPTSVLTITKHGDLALDGNVLADLTSLEQHAGKLAATDPDQRVIIMADRHVPYGRVIQAIGALRKGGLSRFAFGVQGTTSTPPPPP